MILARDTLFRIRSGIASYSPEFRARVVSERIQEFARDLDNEIESIRIRDNVKAGTTDIVTSEGILVTIADVDAAAAGQPREKIAREALLRIRASVSSYRKTYSVESLIKGTILTLVATVILILSIKGILRSAPIIQRNLRKMEGTRIKGLRILGTEILSAERFIDLSSEFLKFFQLSLLLVLGYIYINLTLSFFPWTQDVSLALFGTIMKAFQTVAAAVLGYLPNLFFLGIIVLITHYILKVMRYIFTEIERGVITFPDFDPEWAQPTFKLVQILILAFAATVCFPYLPGSATPAFQGVSIFVGVLVSLGSTGAVANTVAGVILTYTRAFRIGDRVQITDTNGDIVDKTLFVTRIRTPKNEVITIPNATVLSNSVINYSAAASTPEALPLILHTTVTLGYDIPWRQVEEVLIRSALSTEGIQAEPAPFVLQKSLDDFYVSYELNAFTRDPASMARIYSDLHRTIQDNCAAGRIEILSPHYRAMRNGNPSTIPAHQESAQESARA